MTNPVVTQDPSKRTGFIGGTDIQHILSLEPYGCARKLYYQKLAFPQDREFRTNGPIIAGTMMEAGVAELVTERTGWKLRRRKAEANGHEGARIDREIVGHERGPGVLEIKTVSDQAYWGWKRDGVPLGYLLQIQWYMRVMGRAWGALAAFNRDTGVLEIYEFDARPEFTDAVARHVEAFWQRLERRDPPPWLEERDGRCESCQWEATCRDDEWAGVRDFGGVRMDELADIVARYKRLKGIAVSAESEAESVRAEIEAALGDNSLVQIGGYKASWKTQETWRVPTAVLKAKYPEIYEELAERSVSRPLRITEPKGATK